MSNYLMPISYLNQTDIKDNIRIGITAESMVLDFKRDINLSESKKDTAFEIASDICQFANTWGGTILLGVDEKQDSKTNLKVASSFVGVSQPEKIREFINDSVLPNIYPNMNPSIIPISFDGFVIIAINVEPIHHGLACVFRKSSPEKLQYPIRTEYGKKYLKPFEVDERMNNQTRYTFLYINKLFSKYNEVKLLSKLIKEEADTTITWDHRGINIYLTSLGDDEFQIKVNGEPLNIPYGLVREVWKTEDEKIGIILGVDIVISKNRTVSILHENSKGVFNG